MSLYEKAWQDVHFRIVSACRATGRDPEQIRLLAVTKGFSPEAVRAAYALGQRAFGENYVQEATVKMKSLSDIPDIEWHLIGPLQRNKTRAASDCFAWVETISRLDIAQRLATARSPGAGLNVCVQVNISGESAKSGVAPDEAVALALSVARLPQLTMRGLMGIAQETQDVARQRTQFRILRQLFEAVRAAGLALDTLSMGMSADLEAAIAEGATLVRVGSALFGSRPQRSEGLGA
ncbi:MAG: YggS family pyridoxal phosphate-dependent enzyme [Betaproteobacteria bacterium]|nr:MAG: YggS family pyridoxal phosphate-dependent enzyme [Betaproteobacteria bacterium]